MIRQGDLYKQQLEAHEKIIKEKRAEERVRELENREYDIREIEARNYSERKVINYNGLPTNAAVKVVQVEQN